MKVFRYNVKNRSERRFNTTGREKNPNNISFYALSLEYADAYKNIYNEDGEFLYEADLEVKELSSKINLFDMENDFESLDAFNAFVEKEHKTMIPTFEFSLKVAKTKRDKNIAQKNLDNHTLENTRTSVVSSLKMTEFQSLSDYENQNTLIAELKDKGFDGYKTEKEVALF